MNDYQLQAKARQGTFPLCVFKHPVSLFCLNQALCRCPDTVILALVRKPSRSPLALHIDRDDWIVSTDGFITECSVPYFYFLKWDEFALIHSKRWWPGLVVSSGRPSDCYFGASFELIKLAPKYHHNTNGLILQSAL